MKRSSLLCIKATVMLAVTFGAAGIVKADNIVINGDFSSGSFSPAWSLSGDSSGAYVTSGQLTGSTYQAALTTNADDNGYLMQTLTTVPLQQYTLSFLLGGDGATPNSFSASLGGTTLENLTDVPADLPTGVSYSVNYTATSASTVLSFAFDDAPGYLYLANVSVVAIPTSVPEPATIITLGMGTFMLTGFHWMRRRRSNMA